MFKLHWPKQWNGKLQINLRKFGGYRTAVIISPAAIEIEWWAGRILTRILNFTWFGIERWQRNER